MNLFEKIGSVLFKSVAEKKYDDKILKEISELSEDQGESNLRFFKDKETGKLRWISAWSSNYEDDDRPSDILSAEAHKAFVEKVEKGTLPYPELWHWHTKGTRWGETDWLAYDEEFGINWASGTIDEGHEKEALQLMKSDVEIGVSHGMKDIKRDPHDNKVITQYVTYEISDLPLRWAANKMTALFIAENNSMEDDMALRDKQKEYLKKVGLEDGQIEELDKFGKEQADKFSGRARKDKEDNNEEDIDEKDETAPEDVDEEENADKESETAEGDNGEETDKSEEDTEEDAPEEKESDSEKLAAEIKSSMSEFTKFNEEVVKALERLQVQIDEVKKSQKEITEREKEKELEPLSASLFSKLSSIGTKEAELDEEDELAKDKPDEADPKDDELGNGISDFISKNLFPDG